MLNSVVECLGLTMDRDHRTVKVREQCSCSTRCRCGCRGGYRCGYYRTSTTKVVRRLLTLSACLLSLAHLPLAMAAPSPRRQIPMDKPDWWDNPCGGIYSQSEEQSQDNTPSPADDRQILEAIIISAVNARKSVDDFKNKFVEDTFKEGFDTVHSLWKDRNIDAGLLHYEKVPKGLGIKTQHEHLQNIELDKFLKDSYLYMQTMAVAIEQVVWDQEQYGSNFVEHFKQVEYRLRSVLCEIQMAIIERKIPAHPNATRAIMSDKLRNLENETDRNLRDWIIFRDYMIVLEYIKDVLSYFCDNPSRITPS